MKSKFTPFVPVTYELLSSDVYKDLPPNAFKVLPLLQRKVKLNILDTQYYTRYFEFSYKEAARYGFNAPTFKKAIKDLVAYGFITVVKGGVRGEVKTASRYTFSENWKSYKCASKETYDATD